MEKEFWKSKTLWFNVLAVIVFVASQFGFADFQPNADLLAIAAAVINLLLRFLTQQPLAFRL